MNLTTLKAQAEAARADSVELELWRESIEVDEYLRLVEVARAAKEHLDFDSLHTFKALNQVMEGIEL